MQVNIELYISRNILGCNSMFMHFKISSNVWQVGKIWPDFLFAWVSDYTRRRTKKIIFNFGCQNHNRKYHYYHGKTLWNAKNANQNFSQCVSLKLFLGSSKYFSSSKSHGDHPLVGNKIQFLRLYMTYVTSNVGIYCSTLYPFVL